mgnify:CR=1 FL=1
MRTPRQKRPWYRRVGWWDLLVGVASSPWGPLPDEPRSGSDGPGLCYGIAGVIVGVADILRYIRVERFTGFGPLLSLISGVLSVMAGVVILVNPGVGIAVFSLLFSVWFIAHCISRLAGLSRVRLVAGRGMYCFALALNLIGLVAGILLAVMPFTRRRSFGLPGRVVPHRVGSGKRCHGVFPPVRWRGHHF